MKNLIIIMSILMLLNSCNSLRKSMYSSKLNQETTVSNDISLTTDKHLSELTSHVSESFINELLSIDIVQTKYDTEKQIDKETKKYPVSEETKITIKKKRDISETDSIYQEVSSVSVIEFADYSDTDTRMKIEIKEEKESILKKYRKILVVVCSVFFIFMIFRIRRWKTLI